MANATVCRRTLRRPVPFSQVSAGTSGMISRFTKGADLPLQWYRFPKPVARMVTSHRKKTNRFYKSETLFRYPVPGYPGL
jgi:hypothetical protein